MRPRVNTQVDPQNSDVGKTVLLYRRYRPISACGDGGVFINWVLVGTSVKDAILRIAQVITWDFVPGLISLALLSLLVVLVLKLWAVTRRRCRLLNAATRRIRRAGDRPGFQSELHGD